MICCLCLKNSEDITHVFGDNEGHENIAVIVAKHFWFEPLKSDPHFTAICKICWSKLNDFHEFYEMVEVAHQRYKVSESVTVKTESSAGDFTLSPSKHEHNNDFEELDEVPISTILMVTKKSGSKSLMCEKSHFNVSQNISENDNTSNNASDIEEFQTFQYESENSDPFDDAVLTTNEVSIKKEPLEVKTTEISRTIKLRKSPATVTTEEDEIEQTQPRKPRKRRKCNDEDNPISEIQEPKSKKRRGKEKCNKNVAEESDYKRKMKSFDVEIAQYMGLHCDVCNVAVENFAGVKSHMRSEHDIDNGYVKCCDKKFHKRANLLHHIRHHVDPNCYSCKECGQTLNDYQSLRNHLFIKHQKDEDKIFECTECPKKFAKKYLLEQHRTFKHKERFKQCKTCNRRYKTLDELKEHNKEPCSGGRMCDICAKVIFGPGAFKRHQLDHDESQAHKVQCDMCGSWHKDKYALRKHKKRHLEPKTPHVCDICQKVSPSRDAMECHKKYAHRSDRTFECEFCQKSFKRPRSLREHMSTHTGASLYTCPHCPKTFNSNANMHSHRKNVHPVEFEEARKRRQRVVYMGNQTSMTKDLKSQLNVVTADNVESDLSQIKMSDPIPVYNIN